MPNNFLKLPRDMSPIHPKNLQKFAGICLEWLCSPVHSDDPERSVVCLRSLETLLSSEWPSKLVGPNSSLTSEIATVMHR